MLGMHNFYKGEEKSSDNIVITIELNEVQQDGAPKDEPLHSPSMDRSESMTSKILLTVLFLTIALISYGQRAVVIDGDRLVLTDTLPGKKVFLEYVERGKQNQHAIWISYDRRPGVDPWIREATDRSNRYSEDNFINYFKAKGINILGAITTDDNCECDGKCKASWCPDMYLIHFKISPEDWNKLKEVFPENYLKTVKMQ